MEEGEQGGVVMRLTQTFLLPSQDHGHSVLAAPWDQLDEPAAILSSQLIPLAGLRKGCRTPPGYSPLLLLVTLEL